MHSASGRGDEILEIALRLAIVANYGRQYIVGLPIKALQTPYSANSARISMRFTLVDRVIELEPGAKIVAVKHLSLAEEYLADHFPGFPVLPGVLMLEAMTQASAWLVRVTDDFAHSVVVLKEARNVKYNKFVEPGQALTVTAEWMAAEPGEVKLKAVGEVDGEQAVSGRLVLARYNLADSAPDQALTDQIVKHKMRELLSLVYRPGPAAIVATAS